jgi:membrane glycosyltransferase
MTNETLYPVIPTKESELLLQSRVNEMLDKKSELERDLKHYKKVRTHWTRFDSTLKIVGVVLTVSTSITASVLIPLAAPVIIPTILAAVSAINAGLTETVVVAVSSRKKKLFRERCELIQSYLNKMFVYIEKCKDDSNISVDELEGFHTLIREYNTDMNRLKSGMKENNEYSKLEKQAHSEAKKEIKQELRDTLKEKEKFEMRSRYAIS